MDKTAHTPYAIDNTRLFTIITGNGGKKLIARIYGDSVVDQDDISKFIVRACNSHDDLVEALDGLVKLYIANLGTDGEFIKCITPPHANHMTLAQRKKSQSWSSFDRAREVLAKAKAP